MAPCVGSHVCCRQDCRGGHGIAVSVLLVCWSLTAGNEVQVQASGSVHRVEAHRHKASEQAGHASLQQEARAARVLVRPPLPSHPSNAKELRHQMGVDPEPTTKQVDNPSSISTGASGELGGNADKGGETEESPSGATPGPDAEQQLPPPAPSPKAQTEEWNREKTNLEIVALAMTGFLVLVLVIYLVYCRVYEYINRGESPQLGLDRAERNYVQTKKDKESGTAASSSTEAEGAAQRVANEPEVSF